MKKMLLLCLIITAVLLTGCGASNPPAEAAEDQEAYALITSAELVAIMNERRDSFLLINTHIPFEGNIPTTDLTVPYSEVAENLVLLPEDKDTELIIYCMSNRMAYIAADELVQAGYTNLKLLDGGMLAWHGAGLPIVIDP